MSRYSQNMRTWWQQREPRERWMLGTMFAALSAFVFWYGLLLPLRHARDAAQARHERAALAVLQTGMQLSQLQDRQSRTPPPQDAAALKQAVLQAATEAGLSISREREEDASAFGIEADAASPRQLFAWLDALRLRHGLAPSSLSVARSETGLRVQAAFTVGH